MKIRKATREDAGDLAYLINIAGEGIPAWLWAGMAAQGKSAMETGIKRAAREEGSFSYVNATVAEENGNIMGMVLDYLQPDPYDTDGMEDLPDVIRPLIELEAIEPGSWYVNAIATYGKYRGRGVASTLLAASEEAAMLAGADRMSIIVAGRNTQACRLYKKLGYTDKAARAIVPYPGCQYDGDWLLMVKNL